MALGVRPVHDKGAAVIHLDDLGRGSAEPLQVVYQGAQIAHGVGQRPGQGGENGQIAGRKSAGAGVQLPHDDERAAEEDGDQGHGVGQHLDHGEKGEPQLIDIQVGVPELLVPLVEARPLVILASEGLDHPVAGDILLRGGV